MSVAVDLGLLLRNSKTKFGLTLTHRGVLYALAIRIGNNSSTWIKQETLAKETGTDIKSLQDHLQKIQIAGIVIIEKQKADRRKNQYKFNPIFLNYHSMEDTEKMKVHALLGDEYCPPGGPKLSTRDRKKGAKSPPNSGERGRNDPLNRGRNDPLTFEEKIPQALEAQDFKAVTKSPKEKGERDNKKQRELGGSPVLQHFPQDFFPDDKRSKLLNEHSVRTNCQPHELLSKFESVSKRYKTKSKDWQYAFEIFLIRELPKRTYEDKTGGKRRYDGLSINY